MRRLTGRDGAHGRERGVRTSRRVRESARERSIEDALNVPSASTITASRTSASSESIHLARRRGRCEANEEGYIQVVTLDRACVISRERTNSFTSSLAMFQIVALSDSAVKIAPANLGKSTLEAVTQELESLYVDKVLAECGGLCVTLYEITNISGGAVLSGEGCVCFEVEFKLVLFKPFTGEVLEGKLESSDEHGAHVSIGFFDDVFIPPSNMQDPSEWDEDEKAWIWDYNGERIKLEVGEKVRFRVVGSRFPDSPKTAEELASLTADSGAKANGSFAPMLVVGDLNADGLGMCSWWEEVVE